MAGAVGLLSSAIVSFTSAPVSNQCGEHHQHLGDRGQVPRGRGIRILFYRTSPLEAFPLLTVAPLPSEIPGVATQLTILQIRLLVAICFGVIDLMNLALKPSAQTRAAYVTI